MSRNIKFRAWDEDDEYMFYFGLLEYMSTREDSQDDLCSFEARRNIMEYTGLKDKNGKEIYEGDILRQKKNTGSMGVVKFNSDGIWQIEEIGTKGFIGIDSLWRWAKVTEVIGNIYENPELLK